LKPAPFVYHAPATLAEALELLAAQPNARALAGGQSLMPMLNFRLAAPDHLVDLNRISGLTYIREKEGHVAIGAMTRQRDIETSALVAQRLPLLAEAIRHVGHRQTRNRGTLGGSLAHLDPAAELPTVAMAFDAEVEVQSARGTRNLRMSDFARGMLTNALAADELITEVHFRPWPEGHGHAFVEFARRHGDFAVASAAALVHVVNGKVERVSLTLGGVAAMPVRVVQAEAILRGADAARIAEAASHCAHIEALEDPVYPAWYRLKLAVTLARRALEKAMTR
jgi:aerobic carbon-monoxide dehydrogenase medium subunit